MKQIISIFSGNPAKAEASLALLVLMFIMVTASCKHQPQLPEVHSGLPSCHVIYDAGSSSTRLYIYEQTTDGWLKHAGPRRDALADPVRGTRGKSMSDVDQVVDDLVTSLEEMRLGGFLNRKGTREVAAFDWRKECQLESVSVLATAGMRLAEAEDAAGSELLWQKLNTALSGKVGMQVTTRTISGFEEGLYAWMAMGEGLADDNYGIAEMGGASMQMTFPCDGCDAARLVRVKGRDMAIASYSFLGWGQDEAWKRSSHVAACARGAGKQNPGWQVADCAAAVSVSLRNDDIPDVPGPSLAWYLMGAFRYMQELDIEHYCRLGLDSGFQPESSCFRAVYLEDLLKTLEVPPGSEKSDLDWTLGAVICSATECMAE